MNPMTPSPGGAMPMNFTPLWHPPIATNWIITALIIFAGAVVNRLHTRIRKYFTKPLSFFLLAMLVLIIYQYGFQPMAFAVLFFLLMVWSAEQSQEGFLSGVNTVDWVTNSKRWFVEKVLHERPIGIQEKDVDTYPVQGASPQAGTSAGNT
jgi:hypothetical protein